MLKRFIKSHSNIHFPSKGNTVFIYATPRGGSTWFTEMIWSQSGYKCINEPFNIRNKSIRKSLKVSSFTGLYEKSAESKIISYIRDLRNNKIRFLNSSPLRRNYRLLTQSIVFKVIHLNLIDLGWLVSNFNSKVILVLRHPIPVAMSREVFPLLEAFAECELRNNFSPQQNKFIDKVRTTGTHLEKGVTAWCIHNQGAIKSLENNFLAVTYEQAVAEPHKVTQALCKYLDLTNEKEMLKQSFRASAVKRKSTREKQELLEAKENRLLLINNWRTKISRVEEERLLSILSLFEINIYKMGQDYADSRYLI